MPSQDERIAKSTGTIRQDRAIDDRSVTENREAVDPIRNEEMLAMLRDVNTKLPTPPVIQGYHQCWLSTTNQGDPIEHRMRIGYQLVKKSEHPGFNQQGQQSSTTGDDYIHVNEMVLGKIETSRLLMYMKHLHHDLPLEQIDQLKNSVRIEKDGRGRDVAYTGEQFKHGRSDGYDALGKKLQPSFAGNV